MIVLYKQWRKQKKKLIIVIYCYLLGREVKRNFFARLQRSYSSILSYFIALDSCQTFTAHTLSVLKFLSVLCMCESRIVLIVQPRILCIWSTRDLMRSTMENLRERFLLVCLGTRRVSFVFLWSLWLKVLILFLFVYIHIDVDESIHILTTHIWRNKWI
jgi:hypothetical protein